jgi:hypothetical protein
MKTQRVEQQVLPASLVLQPLLQMVVLAEGRQEIVMV